MLTVGPGGASMPPTIARPVDRPRIVGIEMAIHDRPSFDDWWPRHLASIYDLVDELYLRIDPGSFRHVLQTFTRAFPGGPPKPTHLDEQSSDFGRFQEDHERQQLLAWALETGADWAVCFDADEVLEPGGGQAFRRLLLESPWANTFRLVRVVLSYASHHRPGYVLPRGGFCPWRAFRLDQFARAYEYESDEDGLHCGSVPYPGVAAVTVPDLRVVHYHAVSPAEYMAERAFYAGTAHVEEWGGIDFLYRCDRFGDERLAVPLEQELAGAEERLARVAAGEGLIR